MKSGIKTSEFWLSMVAMVVSALYMAFGESGWVGQLLSVATMVLSALGYTVVRGSLKKSDVALKAAELMSNPQKPPGK